MSGSRVGIAYTVDSHHRQLIQAQLTFGRVINGTFEANCSMSGLFKKVVSRGFLLREKWLPAPAAKDCDFRYQRRPQSTRLMALTHLFQVR